MTAPWPKHPQLMGNYAPIRFEGEASDLVVEGELPSDLVGSLYRIGPNPQYLPTDEYHWFGGDGMVHAFHIRDGRADYRNRWVRTPKWVLEHEARRGLFGLFGNPLASDPAVADKDSGVANTNVVWHGERLLALEELHPPFEIEPDTLAPKGYHRFDGRLPGNMTAHPKLDPETGEMLFFAYFAKGLFTPDIAFYIVDREGRLVRAESFQAPYVAMVHDFIVTSKHVLFPIFPLTGSMQRAMKGGPAFAWEPDLGTRVGVMPRDGTTQDLEWFETDACFVFHPLNAWSEGSRIVADVMQFEAAPLFPMPDGTPVDPAKAVARLCRWTFDLDAGTNGFQREYLDDLVAEFPRVDERRSGLPYRHGYFASTYARRKGDRGTFDQITHVDLGAGARSIHQLPAGDATSEPVFVPRSAAAAEGDGYLLATVYRGAENRSDLLVLDATDVAAPPLATVRLEHRIPFGFHGCWRPAPHD